VLVPIFSRVRDGEADIFVSAITEAELLVRPERDGNTAAIERIGDLLSEEGIYVMDVTRRIARKAAKLRSHNRIALADAIIIATAIETRCEAIIGNDGEWTRRLTEVPYVLLDDIVT
jgi:predicted nucleic acid-binding protein